jgi:hypothetical protein
MVDTTTSTFGPNVTSVEGGVLGGIIMIVGIGITGVTVDPTENKYVIRKGPEKDITDKIG